MFSFFKKNKKKKPDWSPFPDLETHELFERLVSKYFRSKGIAHKILNGVVKIPNSDFGLNELGLLNIAQFCQNEGKNKFELNITGHFETLIRGNQFEIKFNKIKEDYEKVKEYLGVRLYNISTLGNTGLKKTIGKIIGGDLYAMLVYDLPDTVKNVPIEDTLEWNLSKAELWDESLKNTQTKYPPNILNRELQGISFKTVEEDHFFSPNIIFEIHKHQQLLGKHGALISMPTRNIVIIYPINDLGLVNAVNTQSIVTHSVSAKGPGTLSNNVFWFNGFLENQPYEINDGKLVFRPTENFVAMINGLQN